MDHPGRRARLESRLRELEVDAFLVTRLPNVRYLSGFSGSNGQLLLSAANSRLFTDGRYDDQSRRQAPDLDREIYSFEFTPVFAKGCADLGAQRVAFEALGVSYKLYDQLSTTGVELVPTTAEVERLRWTKEPAERELLRAAQAIADRAFEEACSALGEGMSEKEAASRLEFAMKRAGADGLAFDTIVAFGELAAEPHHSPTDRPLGRGEMVKIDFGCVVGGYHSDMTRTIAFGEPSDELREVYEIVRRAQQAGLDAVAAGVTGGDADRVARDIISEAGYGRQYKHSLGHGVGLEIHEGPTLRAGSEEVLPEGAVVTVEPGIYLDGKGGVRIEDMVEVQDGGCVVIPTTTKELLVL